MEILSPCLSSPSLTPPSLLSMKSPTVAASASPQPSPSLQLAAAAHPRRTPTAKRSAKPTKTDPSPPITNPTTTSPPRKKVLVPIGFGTEEMEAVILIDVLRRSGAEVIVASVEPELQVEAFGGTKLVADLSISDCSDHIFDLVALPGGMPGSARLRDCEVLKKITIRQAEEKRLYGAICAAPAVALLPWGLLKRKQTTCHPAFFDMLPTFWAAKSNIQISGELTTSRGPGTAFEFALSLVEQLYGESIAKDVKEVLLVHGNFTPRKEEFNRVTWSVDHAPHVLVPVANGSEEIEVVTVIDILRRAKVNVTVASVGKTVQILAAQGTKIVADKTIDKAADSIYDLIILPGGAAGTAQLQKSKVLKKLLKEQESAGRIYGAVSTSPSVLHKQGFLREKKAAAHPSVMNMLANQGVDGAIIVVDGKLITSRGLATATDFALAIVYKLFGNARALSVAEGLVFMYPKNRDKERSTL